MWVSAFPDSGVNKAISEIIFKKKIKIICTGSHDRINEWDLLMEQMDILVGFCFFIWVLWKPLLACWTSLGRYLEGVLDGQGETRGANYGPPTK